MPMTLSRRHDKRRQSIASRSGAFCLCALVAVALMTGCAASIKHDQTLAAKRALEFARIALIDKNFDKAYEMLSDGGKRHVPSDKFKQSLASMHPRGYPSKLTAVEYEPMAGEKAIYIFLKGQNSEEQFGYRITLEGSADSDYRVLKVDQGSGFPTLSNQKGSFNPAPSAP